MSSKGFKNASSIISVQLIVCAFVSVRLGESKSALERAGEIFTECLPAAIDNAATRPQPSPIDLKTYECKHVPGYCKGKITEPEFFNLALARNKTNGKIHEAFGRKKDKDEQLLEVSWEISGPSGSRVELVARASSQICEHVGPSMAISVSPEWNFDLCKNSQFQGKQIPDEDVCLHLESTSRSMAITVPLTKRSNLQPVQLLDSALQNLFIGRIRFLPLDAGNTAETKSAPAGPIMNAAMQQFSLFQPKKETCSTFDELNRKEVCFRVKEPAANHDDVCSMGSRCQPGGICLPLKAGSSGGSLGYECVCTEGYMSLKGQCLDIDECALVVPPVVAAGNGNSSMLQSDQQLICPAFSVCINTVGSYECVCLPGWAKSTTEANSAGYCVRKMSSFKYSNGHEQGGKRTEWRCNADKPDSASCFHQPKNNNLSNLEKTWREAQKHCQSIGGHLACGEVEWSDEEDLRFLGSTYPAFSWLGLTISAEGAVNCDRSNNSTATSLLGGIGSADALQSLCMLLGTPAHWTHYDCDRELTPICEINLIEGQECPGGWVTSEDAPSSCYQLLDLYDAKTFEESVQACERMSPVPSTSPAFVYKPHLLVINSAKENGFVGKHFNLMTWTGFQANVLPKDCPAAGSWRNKMKLQAPVTSNELVLTNDSKDERAATKRILSAEELEWISFLDGSPPEWMSFLGTLGFGQFERHPVVSGDAAGSLSICSALIPSNLVPDDCSKQFQFICEKELKSG